MSGNTEIKSPSNPARAIVLVGVLLSLWLLPTIASAESVKLKYGTVILLRLNETVTSDSHHVGDMVDLAVATDVVVDGKVVISAGTPAAAEVSHADEAGMIGDAGALAITLVDTKAVDGQRVPLRANLSRKGKDNQIASVAVGVILCPLALLMKGGHAEFASGGQVKAYVQNDLSIQVD